MWLLRIKWKRVRGEVRCLKTCSSELSPKGRVTQGRVTQIITKNDKLPQIPTVGTVWINHLQQILTKNEYYP